MLDMLCEDVSCALCSLLRVNTAYGHCTPCSLACAVYICVRSSFLLSPRASSAALQSVEAVEWSLSGIATLCVDPGLYVLPPCAALWLGEPSPFCSLAGLVQQRWLWTQMQYLIETEGIFIE